MNFQNRTVTIDDQSEPGSWAKIMGEEPMAGIDQILEERGEKYGTFSEVALISQNIKSAMRHSRNWKHLPADMRESMEMVANKMGRMLNGDWTYTDTITDMIGYMKLVLDRLERCNNDRSDVSINHQTENGS